MTFSIKLAFNPGIEKIRQALPGISRQIDLDFTGTYITLMGQPSLGGPRKAARAVAATTSAAQYRTDPVDRLGQ
ncbi:hypothetical protein [Desulfococcus sp.]|uniref:hypothetical protein n=1 Tax=Desulfococcus sp. TaxID=2025834 RepID=UPI0035943C1F